MPGELERVISPLLNNPIPTNIETPDDLLDLSVAITRWPMPYAALSQVLANASEAWRRDLKEAIGENLAKELEWLRGMAEIADREWGRENPTNEQIMWGRIAAALAADGTDLGVAG